MLLEGQEEGGVEGALSNTENPFFSLIVTRYFPNQPHSQSANQLANTHTHTRTNRG